MKRLISAVLLSAAVVVPTMAKNAKTLGNGYPFTQVPFTSVKISQNTFWGARLKAAGAKSVRACASHCVMSGPASERVQNSALEEIVFTDSIPYSNRCAKVKQLSVADMFAETIKRVINNESISSQYLV